MTGWRGASSPRLVLIGCLALPNQEDRSPAFPLRPPTPQPGFHPGGWGGGTGGMRKANGRAERGPGGGLRGRPAHRGKFSQWACAPHPGPWSTSPGHSRSSGSRPVPRPVAHAAGGASAGMVGRIRRGRRGRPRAAFVACYGTTYVGSSAPSGGAGSGPQERSGSLFDPLEPQRNAL